MISGVTPMYERIVVGTDGSTTANQAVDRARLLAQLSEAELHLVYGVGHAVGSIGGASGFDAVVVIPAEAMTELEAQVDAQADTLRANGLTVHSHVRSASGADAVVAVAEEVDADLIVVGNRGMTGARRYFLGSVPNSVAHNAPCSVLIVRTD